MARRAGVSRQILALVGELASGPLSRRLLGMSARSAEHDMTVRVEARWRCTRAPAEAGAVAKCLSSQHTAVLASRVLIVHTMWRIIACAVLLTSGCGEDCDVRIVVSPSSSAAPGTLQAGVRLPLPASGGQPLAIRPDDHLVCATCGGMVTLDAELHEIDRVGGGWISAPDGTMYTRVAGSANDTSDLVSRSVTGELRWRVPVGQESSLGKILAGTADVYIQVAGEIWAFDAATGTRRMIATGQSLLGGGDGRIITVEKVATPGTGESWTLHQLDPAGNAVWSHALPVQDPQRALMFLGAESTPDGGAIVVGMTSGDVDLGDYTLSRPQTGSDQRCGRLCPNPYGGGFLASFDASGTTRWGFTAGSLLSGIALTPRGDVVVTGEFEGPAARSFFEVDDDSFVAIATRAGLAWRYEFVGAGTQTTADLAVAPDGQVWVAIDSERFAESGALEMTVGDLRFSEEGRYVFKLVL